MKYYNLRADCGGTVIKLTLSPITYSDLGGYWTKRILQPKQSIILREIFIRGDKIVVIWENNGMIYYSNLNDQSSFWKNKIHKIVYD